MQHRLRYALRGGEFAFVIAHGDLEALEEIAAYCCDFWNGANSLNRRPRRPHDPADRPFA
jgi:hypothetical protein